MDNKKKTIMISTIIILLLIAIVGAAYAFFSYENGAESEIVTGQIYMNYEETKTISLAGVFPETKAQALARTDENGVFEFTITGRNTSQYPVYYEIDLLEGGVITGKTETSTKILPEHVMIYLEKDGVPVVDGVTYADWNNRRIYTDTVPANQATNIEHKYVLRMWIDESVTISDTDSNADYTTEEWNDSYTSLQVRVVGDFEYKDVATDASCFTYLMLPDEITLDTSEEKVEACKTNMADWTGGDLSTAQDGYQSFCEGTGTVYIPTGEVTLKEFVVYFLQAGWSSEQLISVLPVIVELESNEIDITDYDVSCGTDVVIPSVIGGLPVTRITSEYDMISGSLEGGAFEGKGIESVKFPDTLQYIDGGAFSSNLLTEVTIPDSVISIGEKAFAYNNLTTVTLGKNVSTIGNMAFYLLSGTSIENPIERIINKSGNAFNWKNILDYYNYATVQDPGVVATGTYAYSGYDSDEGKFVNHEIQITSE